MLDGLDYSHGAFWTHGAFRVYGPVTEADRSQGYGYAVYNHCSGQSGRRLSHLVQN